MATKAQQFEILASGVLYDGALISTPYAKFLAAGTSTAKNAWDDANKSVTITKKALDAQGRAIVYGDGVYKVQIYDGDPDAGGVLKFEIDNYKVIALIGNTRTITTATTGSTDDSLVKIDTTSGNITYTLPDATLMAGQLLQVVKAVSANTATIAAASGQTVNGAASIALTTAFSSGTFQSDGINWFSTSDAATVAGFSVSATPTIGDIPVLGTGSRVLIGIQVFTASGTWTKPAGCTAAEVIVIAGGGGGGGAVANNTAAAGGGGGGGAYEYITSGLGTTETVTVGAGGAAGANTGGAGGAGGSSSFGSHCSATGGAGGAGDSTSGTAPDFGTTNGGGAGGAGSGGTINLSGQAGGDGFFLTNALSSGGAGGSAPFGFSTGSPPVRTTTLQSANSGNGYGSGGGGGASDAGGSATTGAAGVDGIVIVKAYS